MLQLRQTGVLVAGMLLALTAEAAEPRVVSVATGRSEGRLVCRLETEGLPTERVLSTLKSGLTSAVDLHLDLLDPRGSVVAGNMVRLRLSFDLWTEVFMVRMGPESIRLPDDATLDRWLARTPWLPVASLEALAGGGPHRIRAALKVHSIAPSARLEVETLVAGPEGQEVSVGISSLIRLFYQSSGSDVGELEGVVTSLPFNAEDLDDAPD